MHNAGLSGRQTHNPPPAPGPPPPPGTRGEDATRKIKKAATNNPANTTKVENPMSLRKNKGFDLEK
jgi:hypothetical protein